MLRETDRSQTEQAISLNRSEWVENISTGATPGRATPALSVVAEPLGSEILVFRASRNPFVYAPEVRSGTPMEKREKQEKKRTSCGILLACRHL